MELKDPTIKDKTGRVIDIVAPQGMGPACPDHRPAAHRQDRDPAKHRQGDHRQSSRVLSHRPSDRRAARGSDRHAALGEGRGHLLDLRRAGDAPRPGRGDGDREGQAAGRAQARRRDPAGFDHPPRPAPTTPSSLIGQGADRRRRRQRPAAPQALLRRGAQYRGRRLPDHHRHRADRYRQPHDEVIFEEFKGTGNSRSSWTARWPTSASSRRSISSNPAPARTSCWLDKNTLAKTYVLRRILAPMGTIDAIEFLLDKLRAAKNNADFFDSMNT